MESKRRLGGTLQTLVALAIVAAALCIPFHAPCGVGGLVGLPLIGTGMLTRQAGFFLGVFWIHGGGKYRVTYRHGCSRCRRGSGLLLRLFGSRWCGRRGLLLRLL